jgi:hypothetical protein
MFRFGGGEIMKRVVLCLLGPALAYAQSPSSMLPLCRDLLSQKDQETLMQRKPGDGLLASETFVIQGTREDQPGGMGQRDSYNAVQVGKIIADRGEPIWILSSVQGLTGTARYCWAVVTSTRNYSTTTRDGFLRIQYRSPNSITPAQILASSSLAFSTWERDGTLTSTPAGSLAADRQRVFGAGYQLDFTPPADASRDVNWGTLLVTDVGRFFAGPSGSLVLIEQ